jgi:hypothetical protein
MSIRRFVPIFSMIALLTIGRSAQSQVVAPSPSDDLTAGNGTALNGPITPTGGYGASIPLDLPSPRGGRIPVPLHVVYTGSTQAGAAGSGWDIPISFVRLSNDSWHRKPSASDGSFGERVTVSLDGGSFAMMPTTPGEDVFVPYVADQYMELHRVANDWLLETANGLEYKFEPTTAVGDGGLDIPDFWVLTQVTDLVGGDHLDLSYETPDTDCGDDLLGGQDNELELTHLQYGFSPDYGALYDIELTYHTTTAVTGGTAPDADRESVCVHGAISPGEHRVSIGQSDLAGVLVPRSELLDAVIMHAKNNLDPTASSHAIRTFWFDYGDGADFDTGLPRLHAVSVSGEEQSQEEALPVESFDYGTLTTASDDTVHYAAPAAIPLGADAVAAGVDGLAGSEVHSHWHESVGINDHGELVEREVEVDKTTANYMIRDFTGDAIPDLVYRTESDGQTVWHLQVGTLTTEGFSLTDGALSGPDDATTLPGVRMIPRAGGLPSLTRVRVVERAGRHALVRCTPVTGRQHQIRAHLAHAGFPIAGDKLYTFGDEAFRRFCDVGLTPELAALFELPRQALHAAEVTFPAPRGGDVCVTSPLPPELRGFLVL